ncbi:MAG: hypothetical protein RSG22_18015 [Comamonas sp.]
MKTQHLYLLAGGVVAAALVWAVTRTSSAGSAGQYIGGAVVDMADGVIGGTVVGVGQIFGIPATNMTKCERAKAEGRTWDASFDCPAGDFLKYVIS